MTTTSIEWTDVTWNPVRGCSRVSEGCRNCYAERVAARFSGGNGFPHSGAIPGKFHGFAEMTTAGPRWTGKVALVPEKLDEPLRWRKPRRVFVNSMSDLFHEALPDEAIAQVFGVMAAASRHTFQVLTKRPKHMAYLLASALFKQEVEYEFACRTLGILAPLKWPLPNVWLGVSVENQATADERIPLLLQTPAAVRFVSYEPALGPVDFEGRGWLGCFHAGFEGRDHEADHSECAPLVDWVIVGGESGPGARPFDVAWARSAVRQCRQAGVAVFVKQLGAHVRMDRHDAAQPCALGAGWDAEEPGSTHGIVHMGGKGGDPAEWPADLRVREFPR